MKTRVAVRLMIAGILLLVAVGSVGAASPTGEAESRRDPGPLIVDTGDVPSSDSEEDRSGVSLSAVVSPVLQYQARLSEPSTGEPVSDGSYYMTFGLYEVASGGAVLWTEAKTVAVADGLLSTTLGDTTPLPLDLFHGQALWLQITVEGESLSPRQPIVPVAYAMSLVPGALVSGNTDSPVVSAMNTGVSSHGLRGETGSTSPGVAGVLGVAGPTGSTPNQEVGVLGQSSDGMGVAGISATQPGVYGHSSSSYGVRGESMGSGSAVFGANYGNSYGVEGFSSQSDGVYGGGGSGSGDYGGHFVGWGGVAGYAGDGYGGYFSSDSFHGVYALTDASTAGIAAVYGLASAVSGEPSRVVGVLGEAASGYGVYGESANYEGVYGRSLNSFGVRGEAGAGSGDYGGYFTGYGGAYGYGEIYGVVGWANASTGNTRGVYGYAASPDGHAGYFNGNVRVVGELEGSDSYLWVPGAQGISASTSGVDVAVWYYGRVALTSAYTGSRYFYIPVTIPGLLYGKEVTVEQLTMYYYTSNAASYIDSTYMYKLTGAASSDTIVADETNRTGTSATSYSLTTTGNRVLNSASGPLNVRVQFHFGSTSHTIYIGGIRLRLKHTD